MSSCTDWAPRAGIKENFYITTRLFYPYTPKYLYGFFVMIVYILKVYFTIFVNDGEKFRKFIKILIF